MSDNRIETSENPEVVVLANRRLYVQGWDQAVVELTSSDGEAELTMEGESVRASGDARMNLRVPHGASLKVTGFGDVTVRDVAGDLRLEQVGGSLTLRDVGAATVQSVDNDLTLRKVDGDLAVSHVGRYLNARGVSGSLAVDFVGSHANIKDVQGDLKLQSEGNVNAAINAIGHGNVDIKSAGVITCKVAPGLNASVRISSYGPISIKVGEVKAATSDGSYENVFGDGEAEIILNAEGPVSIAEARKDDTEKEKAFDFNFGVDLAGLGGMIGEQISGQLEMISDELGARMSGLSDLVDMADTQTENAEEIKRKTEEKVARAQEKIRRAQEKAARKIAAAQRRAESKARREEKNIDREIKRSFNINLRDLKKLRGMKKSGAPESDPVSDEERLMILNMVAEKKITLEEAEALLSALEGK